MSERQFRRLRARYEEEGPGGLLDRRDRPLVEVLGRPAAVAVADLRQQFAGTSAGCLFAVRSRLRARLAVAGATIVVGIISRYWPEA